MAQANVLQTSVSGGRTNALALQGDGVFLPKINATTRLALTMTGNDVGFQVYDTTDNNIYLWTGLAWESVVFSGHTSDTQVLFNDNGVISGSADLIFQKSNGKLTAAGDASFNGITVGKGFNSISSNTAVGSGALASTQSGATNNTASGINSQRYNFVGIGNTSFGSSTLSNLLFSGSSNVAVGYQAGSSLSTGSSNIIIGRSAATEAAASSNQIVFGSTSYWVGTNGGPAVWYAGASGAIGYWRVIINGVAVKIPVYAD
jgi:hypothetical protein